MHIELTDHLRCPRDHEESFLILLPDTMSGRRVMGGVLACPACGWQCTWDNGVPDSGDGWEASGAAPLPADAVPAMLGIEGAGGWIVLAGSAAALAEELVALLPGVGIVAINPPAGIQPGEAIQVIRSGAWPMKSHCLRGLVAGEDTAMWTAAMLDSVLHGRQMIGVGEVPAGANLLASGAGIWVARR